MLIPTHPLTQNWFPSSLPFILLFLAAYLGIHYVFWKPPDNNWQPPKYRELSMAKNTIVAFSNALLSCLMMSLMYRLGYSLTCEPVSRSGRPINSPSDKIPVYMLVFMFIKIMECCDTLIQIIRDDPPTKWLLFHHASMVFLGWLGLRCTPGGTAAILASVNCVSHAIVYAYLATTYFLKTSLPEFVNVINHGQFFAILYLCYTSIQRECDFPVFASGFIQIYVGGLIIAWYFVADN